MAFSLINHQVCQNEALIQVKMSLPDGLSIPQMSLNMVLGVLLEICSEAAVERELSRSKVESLPRVAYFRRRHQLKKSRLRCPKIDAVDLVRLCTDSGDNKVK